MRRIRAPHRRCVSFSVRDFSRPAVRHQLGERACKPREHPESQVSFATVLSWENGNEKPIALTRKPPYGKQPAGGPETGQKVTLLRVAPEGGTRFQPHWLATGHRALGCRHEPAWHRAVVNVDVESTVIARMEQRTGRRISPASGAVRSPGPPVHTSHVRPEACTKTRDGCSSRAQRGFRHHSVSIESPDGQRCG